MTSTEPARATSHPKDRSGAKEVRSTLTRREQRLPLRLTYPPDSPKTHEEERARFAQKNPGVYPCTLRDGTALRLQSPTLSALEFDKVVEPFLDRDLLYPRESDYLMTCSVFAPLQDALGRANLEPGDVDFCLLVGGSALVPQIVEAVDDFFSEATMLGFDDAERTQTAVAHGAAWQAFSLAVRGQGLVRPVIGDSISIRTATGPVELLGDGTELPYPPDGGWAESDRLVAPETSLVDDVNLRVALSTADDRVVMSRIWTIRGGIAKGDPLRLRYRMDVNQVLHLRLARPGGGDGAEEECRFTVENPLASVVNPNAKRDEILELEEGMRTGEVPKAEHRNTVERIAELEADLGHSERALSLLSSLIRTSPNSGILNRMGIVAGRLGDHQREEKFYREAAAIPSAWNGPLFNLALSQERQGRMKEALETVNAAIAREQDPPSLILKARMVAKLGKSISEWGALLKRAFDTFDPLGALDDFELHWYSFGARLAGDRQREQAANEERARRGRTPEPTTDDGTLPETRNEITRRPR